MIWNKWLIGFVSVLTCSVFSGFADVPHPEKSSEQQGILPGGCVRLPSVNVIPHADLKKYTFHGNTLQGIATENMGAQKFEMWRTSLAVGGSTPKHMHETEEIFILLKGKGRATIGDQEVFFEAPCTIICPANVPHQLFNTGDEPSDAILVLGIGSKIVDADDKEMKLPWRN